MFTSFPLTSYLASVGSLYTSASSDSTVISSGGAEANVTAMLLKISLLRAVITSCSAVDGSKL